LARTAATSTETLPSAAARCPACGHPLADPPPIRCPLCDFALDDARNVDVTPYAMAYENGCRGWRRMIAWVWYARWERIKHVALMRQSVASGHFAQINMLLLCAGLALVQATVYGWHSGGTGAIKPAGAGWFHAVGDLWWNPAQTIVVAAVSFGSSWLTMTLIRLLLRGGTARLHPSPDRRERRMTAAVDYSTAFALPILGGLLVMAFRVWSRLGSAGRWSAYPPARAFEVIAGLSAGFGVVLWWFWLVRLGATAPERARGAMLAFLVLGAPLLVASAALGWWFALDRLYTPLFSRLGMAF